MPESCFKDDPPPQTSRSLKSFSYVISDMLATESHLQEDGVLTRPDRILAGDRSDSDARRGFVPWIEKENADIRQMRRR